MIEDVTERQLRRQLSFKRSGDYTYAILEKDERNFIQIYGGGSGCCLELRVDEEGKFFRAFLDPPGVPWKGMTKVGVLELNQEEFLHISQVTEAFASYLTEQPFPEELNWRDITSQLRKTGIDI